MNNPRPPTGQVCCPVCTLFLREGMTLQTHLYTHPIDQVIDALVRVSLNQAHAASVPVASSHYTAITYQQFLSSTSIPAVEPNLMLFNPSVVSQQFIETPPTPSPILQSPFQNALRSSMSVLPYNYCTSDQQAASNGTSASAAGSISSDNMINNNSNNKEIINISEKNSISSRIENEKHDHISEGFSVIAQSCQEPQVVSANVNKNHPESEDCRVECTEAQPEDEFGSESPKSQHNSNDSDEEVEREEGRTEFVNTYVCCDNNIGTVISDSQRLIENDPNLEYDRQFRTDASFSEEQVMFDQQAPREETVSPASVSSVSNWSSGSALRVRKDLNNSHSMFNYDRTSGDPLELSSDAFNDNSRRSTSGLLNLDTPVGTRGGYSINEHLEEQEDYIENKDDNSDQSPPLNIHSDELMPPRGELSGQESLGATENSVWEMQAVREKSPEIPSYQLLERGRWEVSVSSNNELSTAARPAEKRQTVVYKCLQCGENFKCPKERRVHVSSVHHNKRTQVKKEEPICSLSPNKFDPLFVKQEVAGVKTEPNCKTCQDCGLELPTIKELKKHRKEQHQDRKANRICSTCNEYFPDTKLYRLHIAKVHPLECVDCGKCFLSRQNLTLHQKRHLKVKPYHCSVCDKSFVTRQKLTEHENGHSGNAPYKCTLCGDRTFKRYSNLIQHKNCYHLKLKKKLKDFFCHCGEVFHSVKKLEWHKEIHEQKPKHCIYCSEKFIHSASLTRHIRRSHDSEYLPNTKVKMENVQCPICHQVYLKTSLASHMKHIHGGEKKFSCTTCAKEFSTKWNLHLHKWTHASRTSKPFKCKLCKAAFYHIKDYQAHNRSHRNIRPYTCNHCGQQFIRKYNCIRHVREHEVSKSFSCQVCGKLFHRSYYLTEHMRVHTGVKPYSCHICAKTSSTKSNHNKHVKTHHAREPLNTEDVLYVWTK